MSGIVAARDLSRGGLRVILLEGRERLGGRVWTSKTVGDLGASWVHGGKPGNPVYDLAIEAGLPLRATDYDASALFDNAGRMSSDAAAGVWAQFERIADRMAADIELQRAAHGSYDYRKTSLRSATEAALAAEGVPPGSAEERAIRFEAVVEWEHEFGGSAAEMSAAHFDEGAGFAGTDFVFPAHEGFGAVVCILEQQLGPSVDLLLGARVTAIASPAEAHAPVQVSVADGRVFRGRAVVVTLPIGILHSSLGVSNTAAGGTSAVSFSPPLSPSLASAALALGCGVYNKYIVLYEGAAAEAAFASVSTCDMLQFIDELPSPELPPSAPTTGSLPQLSHGGWPFPEMLNWGRASNGKRLALVAFSAGAEARRLSSMSDAAVRSLLLAQVRGVGFVSHCRGVWHPPPIPSSAARYHAAGAACGACRLCPHSLGRGPLFPMLLLEHCCGRRPDGARRPLLA